MNRAYDRIDKYVLGPQSPHSPAQACHSPAPAAMPGGENPFKNAGPYEVEAVQKDI
eukprot:gene13142-13710_t